MFTLKNSRISSSSIRADVIDRQILTVRICVLNPDLYTGHSEYGDLFSGDSDRESSHIKSVDTDDRSSGHSLQTILIGLVAY